MSKSPMRVTDWNEYRHEYENSRVAEIHSTDIHGALAESRDVGWGS